jgi:hypothetical protein
MPMSTPITVNAQITTVDNIVYAVPLTIPGVMGRKQELNEFVCNYIVKQGYVVVNLPNKPGKTQMIFLSAVKYIELDTPAT